MWKPYLASALCLLLFAQCRNKTPPGTVVSLAHYPSTVFVPTLEESFKPDRNVIYTPAFLLAWDGLKKEIKLPLMVSRNSYQLNLVNRSNAFKGALAENEYEKEISVRDEEIGIRTFFHKSLDFEVKLDSVLSGFKFKGKAVRAFGMPEYRSELAAVIQVLYYKSDNDFIVKLLLRERQQELILVKGAMEHNRLDALWRNVRSAIAKGRREMKDSGMAWKYSILDGDALIIPVLRFNIETHYNDIEGQYIRTPANSYEITAAYQRTALTLDEHGAVIESEGYVESAMTDSTGPAATPKPKQLFFDKPFLIVMRKIDAAYPYFMMKVENAELMEKR
jgi:hypothetical protein